MVPKNNKPENGVSSGIVCLSYDTVDILCSIGCGKKIIGKPSGINKPELENAVNIGGFGSPDIETIVSLRPELVIGYSEICSKTIAELTSRNINTLVLHHTSLSEIYGSISLLGRITGNNDEAIQLIASLQKDFRGISAFVAKGARRPKVYFEEWNQPPVCGVQWVSEIIGIAGGQDCFASRCRAKKYLEREVTAFDVAAASPEIILASWCGKPVDINSFKQRSGWESVPAVKTGRIYPVPGEFILQPGPSLVKGAKFLHDIFNKQAS
jgi:iron complex transport system substrate-binding protein